ncbi:MAG: hypothetical protein GXP54_12355 [Deltaproteobacteria bacterium]|nr:hypothetical protein [Deltaproteobacteria bacterium]
MGTKRFFYIGIFCVALGTGLFLYDQVDGRDWFTFRIGEFGLSAGLLWILLGALNMVVHFQTLKHLRLSDEELRLYSEKLEEAAPSIINMVGRKVKAGEIADRILESHRIPRIVTLKYIIALGEEKKKEKEQGKRSE